MTNREKHKQQLIETLTHAQRIAFAPLMFQAVNSIIEFGILKSVDTKPHSKTELMQELNLNEYTVTTLLEAAEVIGIIEKNEKKEYSSTQLGQAFLYDEMTKVNFEYVRDVCYRGAESLTESFQKGSCEGFKKLFPKADTIYPYLTKLPAKMQRSWYGFDHYYSDCCFDIVYKIISDSKKIFDIGANTGKFERLCLKKNPNIDITMVDLPDNIEYVRNDKELEGCKFFSTNVLDEKSDFPQISGAVLMSQFLDCFSKEQIIFILKRIALNSSADTKVYILEPFIDRQRFEGAKFSLIHTSLYFTCMANGKSKMYSYSDMEEMINQSGWKISSVYDEIGAHDYTFLECVKNV